MSMIWHEDHLTISVQFYTVSPKPTLKTGASEVGISTFMEIM